MADETLHEVFSGLFPSEDAVRNSLQEQHAIVGVVLPDGRVATYSDSQPDHGGCVRNKLEFRIEVAYRICGCKNIRPVVIKIISTNDGLADEQISLKTGENYGY